LVVAMGYVIPMVDFIVNAPPGSPRFERWGAWWCVDDEVDHWDDVAHCDDEKHEYDSTAPAFCPVWCFWCVFFFFGNWKFCFSFWSKEHQMYNRVHLKKDTDD